MLIRQPRPFSTIRRWLRRLPAEHLERLYQDGSKHLRALDPDTFTALRFRGTMLTHTLSILAAARPNGTDSDTPCRTHPGP